MGFLIVCFACTPLFSEVIVEGEVSGEWVYEESPYVVVGDITVTLEGLTIAPGVQVMFTGYYTFEVIGFLSAVGDSSEDRRIIFSSDSVLWQGIIFNQANQVSELINCDISNTWIGINCIESRLRISGCDINAQNTGINCDGSSPEITDNRRIRVFGSADDHTHYTAINLTNNSNPQIIRNLIQCEVDGHTDAYGIYMRAYSGAVIDANLIETRSSSARAHSIDVRQVSKLEITSNIIKTNSPQSQIVISTEDATGVEVYQNTLVMTGTSNEGAVGIKVGTDSRLSIINNIIVGNGSSVGVWNQYGQIVDGSGFNDFYQHAFGENLVGEWPDFDLSGNLLDVDPLFIDTMYTLRGDTSNWPDNWEGRSPCIDAGNPDWIDPDETRSDIGRWYVHHEEQVGVPDAAPAVEDYELVEVFPNPFNETTRLTFRNGSTVPVRVSIYDLQGRLIQGVFNNTLPAGKHNISLKLGDQAPGMYILRLDRPSATVSRRLIYIP